MAAPDREVDPGQSLGLHCYSLSSPHGLHCPRCRKKTPDQILFLPGGHMMALFLHQHWHLWAASHVTHTIPALFSIVSHVIYNVPIPSVLMLVLGWRLVCKLDDLSIHLNFQVQ